LNLKGDKIFDAKMAVIDNLALFLARTPVASSTPLPPPPLDFTEYMTSPRQQGALFMVFFFPALALITVCLRIYNRLSSKSFGWDDGLIIAAMVCSKGYLEVLSKISMEKRLLITNF
jgi:hypothetical protein